VRDLDVFNGYLRDEITRLEPEEQAAAGALLEALAAEREAAREGMLEALRSKRYLALLRRLEEAGRAPQTVPADLTLPEVAAQEFKRLRRAMRAFEADGSDEELHRARIRGKRGRYAAELAGPKAGKREKRFVERAKAFQDVIGEHQDAVVAEARIRELLTKADGGELTAFAAGRLVEHQRARRREARQAVPQAWRRLEQSGRRAWS